jgi:signal transduction histidine kinase
VRPARRQVAAENGQVGRSTRHSTASFRCRKIDREPTDLASLLEDVVESFRPFAAAKRATIALDVGIVMDSPAVDRNVCRQIALNLLDNAIKYGPPGQTVHVRVSAVPGGVELAVADEGPGVPTDQRRRIWEPFWRAPASAEGGSGLGLAIVRDLARRHGGTATVSSGPDGGARFVVMLRTTPPPNAAAVGTTQTA